MSVGLVGTSRLEYRGVRLVAYPTHRYLQLDVRVLKPSGCWAIDDEFPRPSGPSLFEIRDDHSKQISCLDGNPRCENNLGDVDKYRYSVALVEFWFRTDATLHTGLV